MVVPRTARLLAALVAVLAFAGVSQAQTYRWTGNSSTGNSNWGQVDNWIHTGGGFPVFPNNAAHTALFDTAGNGRTNINLAGGPFTLNSLQFNTAAAAAYNIGGGGAGTLNFAANGTTTPTIVMNASVTNAQIVSGAVSLASGLTVTQNSTANLTLSGVVSGANSFTKAGSGQLILTTENTFSGGTTVNGGTLNLNKATNTAVGVLRGTVTVNSGGTLLASSANAFGWGAGTKIDTLNINGTGLVSTTAAGDQGWGLTVNMTGGELRSNTGTSDAAAASYYSLGGGSAINSLDSATTALISGRINLREGNAGNTLTFTTADGAAALDLNVTAAITEQGGARNIAKAGAGVMQLTGNNTYTGTTTVSGGVLSVSDLTTGAASSVGSNDGSAGFLVLDGGLLRYTGGELSTTRGFTVGTAGGGIEASGSGALTVADPAALVLAGTDTARTFTLGGTSTAANTFAAVVEDNGTGATSLAKTGAGTWTLTGNNTYTGTTTVSGGVLSVSDLTTGAASSVGSNDGSAGFLVLDGGLLRYTGGELSTTRGFTVGAAGGGIEASGSGALTVADPAALVLAGTDTARTFTLGGTSTAANTFAAVVEDNGTGATSLAKTGAGTWTLTGNNTYTGTTTVAAGTLQIGNGGATGALGTGDVMNDGTLAFNRAATYTVANAIGGSGGLLKLSTGTTILTGANTYAGTTTISEGVLQIGDGGTTGTLGTGDVTSNGTLRFNRTDAVTVANAIGGSGTVVQSGTGTLYLNGTNTHTGSTQVIAGTLSGTGTAGGLTIVGSSGTLRAGTAADPTGTLTLANGLLTAGGSTLGVRITTAGDGDATGTGQSTDTGGVHNKLVISSSGATLSTLMNILVDVTGSTFANSVQQSYRLMTGAGDQSGLSITDPARFTFTGLTGSDTYEAINVSLTGDAGGNVFLNFTPVPEPATVLGVGAAVLGLAAVRRRRLANPAAEGLAA